MCHPEDVSPMVFSFDFFDSEKEEQEILSFAHNDDRDFCKQSR